MTQTDLPNYLSTITFATSAAVAANANGSPIDLVGYEGVILARVDCGNATAGTSPTLDLVFKQSSDNSTWTNANIAFTQITNGSTQVVAVDTRAVSRYVRLDKVVGGTNSPSFPVAVIGVGIKQYNLA
jgi:hypothetical protein